MPGDGDFALTMDSSAVCTWAVIIVTAIVSLAVFSNRHLEPRFIFEPQSILAGKEYYRLVTSGFLHADSWHLLLNMVSLYFFGPSVEGYLGRAGFLGVYLGAIAGGNLLSLYVHRNHEYRAYGASGGVCGIIFAHILLFPGTRIFMFPLPMAVPGWAYAIAFIVGSFYGMRTGAGNIGHDAHLGGAIVGLLIAAGMNPEVAAENWKVFAIVLGAGLLVLVYLWVNPLLLPSSAFAARWAQRNRSRDAGPPRITLSTDAILEKIAREGIDSLTREEREFLDRASASSRRRGDSEKPGSGLSI